MAPASTDDETLRYPIGRFERPKSTTPADRDSRIQAIAEAPAALRAAVAGLDESRLATPYRPGGWSVRQVVHHVPDSHLNAYVRVKLALTEEAPVIKPYDESAWAELADGRGAAVATSLALLEALHERWVMLWRAFGDTDWKRTFVHPEIGVLSLDEQLALYAWHGRHHVAHITALRQRNGW